MSFAIFNAAAQAVATIAVATLFSGAIVSTTNSGFNARRFRSIVLITAFVAAAIIGAMWIVHLVAP
jgi:hypothetical protein